MGIFNKLDDIWSNMSNIYVFIHSTLNNRGENIIFAPKAVSSALSCREPTANDGAALHALIQQCPPLDCNSMYCNLLQCTRFSQTSAVAEFDGQLLGAVTGFLDPAHQDTWFIWQIAVHKDARGHGLTHALIEHILQRSENAGIRFIETSITESNAPSWGVFEKLAQKFKAPISHEPLFERNHHFNGMHASETLVRIGPFSGVSTINKQVTK